MEFVVMEDMGSAPPPPPATSVLSLWDFVLTHLLTLLPGEVMVNSAMGSYQGANQVVFVFTELLRPVLGLGWL